MDNTPTKKSLGQHWLSDQQTLEDIVDASELKETDVVLEIGPGTGNLTKLLVERASKVIAIEIDEHLAKNLPKADNLSIIKGDIRHFDLNKLDKGYKLIANIPYYLTSYLIRLISETDNPPALATLLIQKEVAEALQAKPGNMSILSVTCQFYFEVELHRIVKKELFTPPPKVDSRVVVLKRRPKPLFPDVDRDKLFKLVKVAFSKKRKTLANSLSSGLRLDKETISQVCVKAGIDEMRRPQSLSLEEWHKLYVTLMNT